ncbi:MAG: nicotinate-nucleotide adenylyltransferase [Gammaproteobacteria bacterium]
MTSPLPITILGGTFDPIHYGHLRMALEIQQALELPSIRFVPCQQPVHKSHAHATVKQRLAMLELALQHWPTFTVDTREITRSSPSYMIHTLRSLRQEEGPHTPLILIMGADSFQQLHTWYEWENLLTEGHFVLTSRPGYTLPTEGPLLPLLQNNLTDNPLLLHQQPAGAIYCQPITHLDISSSAIRSQCQEGYNPCFLLPDRVLNYINNAQLYEKSNG